MGTPRPTSAPGGAPVLTLADLGIELDDGFGPSPSSSSAPESVPARWGRPPLAVLGHPIGHSLSPAMHNAALASLAREAPRFSTWRYHRFDVPPEWLRQALDRLHACGFAGLNLTVPHKVLAFGLLGADAIDPAALAAGAVNTLVRTVSGWRGYNTDGYGLAAGIRAELGAGLSGASVLVLGAGGAARGAALACLTGGCRLLWVANRSAASLEALLRDLAPVAAGSGLVVRGFLTDGPPPPELPPGLLVVNATSAGLRPDDPAPVDLAALPRPSGVYDMVYNPPRTRLLAEAARLGLPAAGGLSMLAHQGARALELWTGAPAARTAPTMLSAARAALAALPCPAAPPPPP